MDKSNFLYSSLNLYSQIHTDRNKDIYMTIYNYNIKKEDISKKLRLFPDLRIVIPQIFLK